MRSYLYLGYPLYRKLGFEDDRYTHVPMRLML